MLRHDMSRPTRAAAQQTISDEMARSSYEISNRYIVAFLVARHRAVSRFFSCCPRFRR